MNALIAELLALAVAWTGYALPAAVPALEVASANEMPCPCMGFFGYARRVQGYGVAFDIPARLMLRRDVDTDTALGRSILLHELVHALQAQRGTAAYGTSEWHRREREAYRVQARYLGISSSFAPPAWHLTAKDD